MSPDWKSKVGAATAVEWPVGIGAKGNEGVANNVANTKGSIGYVEYAYAKQNKMTSAKMVNKDGKTVAPTSEAFQAAAANADWESVPGYRRHPQRPARRRILADDRRDLHPHPQAAAGSGGGAEALKFFAWAYPKGGKMAEDLDYVPMPAPVVATIEKMWADDIKDAERQAAVRALQLRHDVQGAGRRLGRLRLRCDRSHWPTALRPHVPCPRSRGSGCPALSRLSGPSALANRGEPRCMSREETGGRPRLVTRQRLRRLRRCGHRARRFSGGCASATRRSAISRAAAAILVLVILGGVIVSLIGVVAGTAGVRPQLPVRANAGIRSPRSSAPSRRSTARSSPPSSRWLIAVPLGLLISLFLTELCPMWLRRPIGIAIELLAGIPSIIYGIWGLFVFAPFLQRIVQPFLIDTFGDIPVLSTLFEGPPYGIGTLTAGLILAIMVLPFITSISRDVFEAVPPVLKEAAYGVGCTTWEVVRYVVLPYARVGVIGGVMLGLGRALGETMAVTFVIGNAHRVSASILAPGTTISATIANEFTEAVGDLYTSSLIALGLHPVRDHLHRARRWRATC